MLRADSMCDVTVQQGDILVVEDATADPRFADRGVVTGSPHVRFYAGRPLVVGDGFRVGTICIIDSEVRGFSEEEREISRTSAGGPSGSCARSPSPDARARRRSGSGPSASTSASGASTR